MESLTTRSSIPSSLSVLTGPVILSQRSSYRSVIRRLGAQVFLAAYRLLHMCTHSTDEDQPLVRNNFSRLLFVCGFNSRWHKCDTFIVE